MPTAGSNPVHARQGLARVLGVLVVAVMAVALGMFAPRSARATNYTVYDMSADGAWRSTAGTTILAQAFSTHSSGTYLASVRVKIRNSNEANSSSIPSTFSASLWSSSAGLPLAKITDLATNQSVGAWGDGDFTFTPTTDITLGTTPATYFVVVSGNAGGTIGWKCNAATPSAAEPAGSYPMATSTNGGTSWTAVTSGACAGQYFNMTVIATDVSSATTSTLATTTTPAPTTTTTPAPATTTPPRTITGGTTTTSPAQPAPAPVAPTTTTLVAATTTTTTPPAPPATEPEDTGQSQFFASDIEASFTIIGAPGTSLDQVEVLIDAEGLEPRSAVTLTIHSEPVTLLSDTASAEGTFTGTALIPPSVGPGEHTVVLDTTSRTGPERSMGTVSLDTELRIISVAAPSVVSPDVEPGSTMANRASTSGTQIYDASVQPAATAALAVTATAVLSLMGAGASAVGASVSRERDARGKLAGFVTKKLKPANPNTTARGDASRTWQLPFTAVTDGISQRLPNRVGVYSAALPRMAVDGAWLRASLGSAGYALWVAGFVAGLFSGLSFDSIVAPAAMTATIFAAIGILDSGAGMAAWLGTLLGVIIGGNLADWYDVRTLLGMAVLYSGLAPLAHVIRPLRRMVQSRGDLVERLFDYAITPVFLAFAGGSMLKALNGLSALKLVSPGDVSRAIWVFATLIVVRFAAEDAIRMLYPERMARVQPQKLTSPSRRTALLSVLPRSGIILFVAVPFFGLTWKTLLSTFVLAIPALVKPFEDDLPNSPLIHRWLPRGLFRFLCQLVVGLWLGSWLVPVNDPQSVRDAAVWLLVPGAVVGVLEGFGREGGDWNNTPAKWVLGVPVWLCAAGLVTGAISIF